MFVGVRARSGELWIATLDGIIKARSVRRIPVQSRWSMDCVKWVKFVPRHLHKDHPGADGDIPEEKVVDGKPVGLASEAHPPPVVVCTRKVPPRAFQIRKEDAERHGHTRGRPGCTSWFRGLGRQAHTPECRTRFAEALKGDARFQKAEAKRTEFEEKAMKRDEKKRRRGGEAEGVVPGVPGGEVPGPSGGVPGPSGGVPSPDRGVTGAPIPDRWVTGPVPIPDGGVTGAPIPDRWVTGPVAGVPMVTEPIQGEIGKRASAASAELEDGWQEYASRINRAKANIPEDKDIEIQEFEAGPGGLRREHE